jgi:hypothetical protein
MSLATLLRTIMTWLFFLLYFLEEPFPHSSHISIYLHKKIEIFIVRKVRQKKDFHIVMKALKHLISFRTQRANDESSAKRTGKSTN